MRAVVESLEESRIREVANEGLGRSDVLKFWFGESDEVTPDFIREAAVASLQKGETFYAHNLGLPELRQALADYTSRLHAPAAIGPERIAVTSGGVNALMLAMQMLIDAGDEVLAVTPVWPNLTAQPLILGARLRCLALKPQADGAWALDLPALLAAITPTTRLLVVNSPNNPTGWTLSKAEQQAIVARCRETGTWILADEVYERLYYRGYTADGLPPGRPKAGAPLRGEAQRAPGGVVCAPSFLDVSQLDDRLVVVQSFSKAFLMTGWRLGYLVMPAAMTQPLGKLIEFNTSCAPVFVQRAAALALAQTDTITPRIVQHLRQCRDTLVPLLQALPGVQTSAAPGGMYAFLRVGGFDDSLHLAKRLVLEAGVGLAPGVAFAPEAEGWLRWCFASKDLARLEQGVRRMADWLAGAAASK